jgi:hypothetical protein
VIDSESEVGEDLVRDLLREQHPDLADLPIREVGGRLGNQMRTPGRRLGRPDAADGPKLRYAARGTPLAAVAARLPLAIPTPVRPSTRSERFGKIWTVMTSVDSTLHNHGTITRGDHAAYLLAAFLQVLHVEASADAPSASDFGTHLKDSRGGFEHFPGRWDPRRFGFTETTSGSSGTTRLLG